MQKLAAAKCPAAVFGVMLLVILTANLASMPVLAMFELPARALCTGLGMIEDEDLKKA